MSRRARRSLQNLRRKLGRSGRRPKRGKVPCERHLHMGSSILRFGGNPSDSGYARSSKGDPVKIPEPGRGG
ncbi:hypothetical protein YC2023_074934 [Brassica napus]